ncbi:hypothetical protein HN011_001844 [Eciton burchellii]|nr:hypothetical protein HN011_001844 [Eciton burchellii]
MRYVRYVRCTIQREGLKDDRNDWAGIAPIVQGSSESPRLDFIPRQTRKCARQERNSARQRGTGTSGATKRVKHGLSELFRPVIGTYAAYGITRALAGRACSPSSCTRSAIKPSRKQHF